jgi:5'-3' exonuclease
VRTALIDGDILLFQYGFRGQSEVDWGEGVVSQWTTESLTIGDMVGAIAQLMKILRADHEVVCFTGKRCFRYGILPSYKHNRVGSVKPLLYGVLKQYLLAHYQCAAQDNLEADDMMGIMQTMNGEDSVICTIDKDLNQIPGKHFNWNKDSSVRVVPEKEADLFFYRQALTGDPTDGFSGASGIGKVKAQKALDTVLPGANWEARMWEKVVEVYASKGLDEDYALSQARMARILRAEDYDFEKKEPILWLPEKVQS